MKIIINVEHDISEDEIIIRCHDITNEILHLQNVISENIHPPQYLTLRKKETEYFIRMEDILFFETDNSIVYAHTKDNLYQTVYKLYELEQLLPFSFMRISKSAIVNLNEIFSIKRNLTASSVIEFYNTPKQVYVSRQYYRALIIRMEEKTLKNKVPAKP